MACIHAPDNLNNLNLDIIKLMMEDYARNGNPGN
jgi:hypothetical protein